MSFLSKLFGQKASPTIVEANALLVSPSPVADDVVQINVLEDTGLSSSPTIQVQFAFTSATSNYSETDTVADIIVRAGRTNGISVQSDFTVTANNELIDNDTLVVDLIAKCDGQTPVLNSGDAVKSAGKAG